MMAATGIRRTSEAGFRVDAGFLPPPRPRLGRVRLHASPMVPLL